MPPRRFCGTQFSPAGALPDRLSFYLLVLRTAGGQPWPPQTEARVAPPARRKVRQRTRDHADLPHAQHLFLDCRLCDRGLAQSRKVYWAPWAHRAQAHFAGRASEMLRRGATRLPSPRHTTPHPLMGALAPLCAAHVVRRRPQAGCACWRGPRKLNAGAAAAVRTRATLPGAGAQSSPSATPRRTSCPPVEEPSTMGSRGSGCIWHTFANEAHRTVDRRARSGSTVRLGRGMRGGMPSAEREGSRASRAESARVGRQAEREIERGQLDRGQSAVNAGSSDSVRCPDRKSVV